MIVKKSVLLIPMSALILAIEPILVIGEFATTPVAVVFLPISLIAISPLSLWIPVVTAQMEIVLVIALI